MYYGCRESSCLAPVGSDLYLFDVV